ncbi:MAG: carboxypeptidase regulatory-like domain-containing protein [Planctomycetes bacterium]|nr:carboxypeptidase regulatory-like domain-containing protein [Planctomycetota bacterium]
MRKLSILFVALVIASAIGYLLWSTRTAEGPKTAASTPTETSAAPAVATPTGAGAKPELVTAATSAPTAVVEGASERTDASIKAKLRGRVIFPAPPPHDEQVEIVATKAELPHAAFQLWSESKGTTWHVTAAADGTFELPVSESEGELFVFAAGRYASSRGTTKASLTANEPVLLEVEFGTWVRGTLAIPEALEANRGELANLTIRLSRGTKGGWNEQMRTGGMDSGGESRTGRSLDGRTFEIRAALGDDEYTVFARPEGETPHFAAGRSDRFKLLPGSAVDVELRLTRGGTLIGAVVDESGAPVADAKLELRIDPKMLGMGGELARESKSGADGRFVLAAVRAGKSKLSIEKDGRLKELFDVELVDGETHDGGNYKLTTGARVAGTVLWPDRTPVADAQITLGFDMAAMTGMNAFNAWRGNQGDVKSDASGAFSIGGLGAGPFTVRAHAAPTGSKTDETDEALWWRASTSAVAANTLDLELVLQAPEGVQGRVVDETEAPITRFQIVARAHTNSIVPNLGGGEVKKSFEDADGRFALTGLDRGGWDLYALAEGFGDGDPTSIELPREGGAEPLTMKLAHAASVEGVVLGFDGNPVAGATVQRAIGLTDMQRRFRPTNEPDRLVTKEDGKFAFAPLSAGPASLIARADGTAASPAADLTLAVGEKKTDVVLRLRRGGTLTGEVFGEDGKPVAGANVLAQDPTSTLGQRMLRSDSSGHFREEHLEPGNWQVIYMPWMSDDGAMPTANDTASIVSSMKLASATIRDGEETHVVLGAPPKNPVLVRGRVSSHGEPVGNVVANFMADGTKGLASLKFVSVGSDGRYETRLDGAGRYLITVQSFGGAGEQQAYEFARTIPEGPEYTLDIELPGARVSGRVFDGEGRPAPKTRVSLTPLGAVPNGTILGGRYSEIITDEDGRYVMRWLDPGSYTLAAGGSMMGGMFGKDNALGRELREITVTKDTDQRDVDFRLKSSGAVTGIVRARNGEPLAGAAIFVRDEHDRLLERLSLSQTGPDGRFRYGGLAAGRYGVSARSSNEANSGPVAIEVRSGESTEVEIALDAGTVLVVKLIDEKEQEVDARVLAVDDHGRQVNGMLTMAELMTVFQEGGFSSKEQRIGPLAAGTYTVTATANDGRTVSKTVSVAGEAEKKLTLRLRD